MNYNFNQASPFYSNGDVEKKIKSNGFELLDKSWEYIINSIDLKSLWKLGVYTNKVRKFENNERGMFIERFFCEQLNGVNLDDITANNYRIETGKCLKYDFILPNNFKINVKTTCVKNKLYNRIGQILSSNSIKIFDTSRNKYNNNQRVSLIRQLNSIDWDINILLYGYEKSSNRCSLHLTSLKEICHTIYGSATEENIINLFYYSVGGSHYFLNREDIFYSAKINNRSFFMGKLDNRVINEYLDRKLNFEKITITNLLK